MSHAKGLRRFALPATIATVLLIVPTGASAVPAHTGPTSSPPGLVSQTLPDTEVGAQLSWLLGAVSDLPLPVEVIEAHFDSYFLSMVTLQELNTALAQVATPSGASVVRVSSQDPTSLVVVASFGTGNWKVSITTDAAGLIDGLLLTPSLPTSPQTWSEIDSTLLALAPDVGFLAAEVRSDGSCSPIHQLDPSTSRPLASQFKLFVLGALAQQIASGKATWNEKLTVRAALLSTGNSPGSGSLQYSPVGSRVSVRQAATKMISISDNTAADMLIGLVGRSEVEAQVRQWSPRSALDVPFLTTRELFLLHYVDYPALATRYLSLPPARRSAFLASSVDPLSLGDIHGSTEPRYIDTIEWFASPDDICRAFAGLQRLSRQPRLSPLASMLSLNTGDVGLDSSKWPTVWFKGGSEPGVLTLGYLARDDKGRMFVVSAMLSDPTSALAADATEELLAVVKGAFELAERTRSGT